MKTLDQPCALRPPLDPVRAAFFSRSKAYTLLKVDFENQRGDVVSDSLLVSKFQTDVNFDDAPSSTGDPHTYRIKLPIEDLGSSTASVKLETYIDGSLEDRNSSEDGVLTLTQKTENGETFYATENFRLVTWDSDDAHEGNRTLRVQLNDTVRASLTIGGNNAGYIELPVGQEPTSASDYSYDAVRTVHVAFHKIGTNGAVPNVSDSDLDATLETFNNTFAQTCIRFVKDGDTAIETWPPFQHLVIEGDATTSGSVEVGYGLETVTVNIAAGSAHSVAQAIEAAINSASPPGNVEAVNTWPKTDANGDAFNPDPTAHLISLDNSSFLTLGQKTGLSGCNIRFVALSAASIASIDTKDEFLAIAAHYNDKDPSTLDVFIVNQLNYIGSLGAALNADYFGNGSDVRNTIFVRAVDVESSSQILFAPPHEIWHILTNISGHPDPVPYLGNIISYSDDDIEAYKRIFDYHHQFIRSSSNPARELLKAD